MTVFVLNFKNLKVYYCFLNNLINHGRRAFEADTEGKSPYTERSFRERLAEGVHYGRKFGQRHVLHLPPERAEGNGPGQ